MDYAAIAESALTAIRDAGRVVTITRYNIAVDPVESRTGKQVELTGEFTCVVLPAKKANAIANFQTGFDNGYIEKLRAGKVRRLLVAASGAPFAPKQGDTVEFDDVAWISLGCTPLAPAGVDVIYQLEVAQG